MNTNKITEWVLRIAVAGEFIGHGMFALQGKAQWVGWIEKMTGVGNGLAVQFLFLIGIFDLIIAFIILVRPIRIALLWATFWGFWTALVRPLVGESFWDFIERFANWGAPLALLLTLGWPKTIKDWLSVRKENV